MPPFSTDPDRPVEIPADLVDANGNKLTYGQTATIKFRVIGLDDALILVEPLSASEGLPGLTAVNPAQLTGLTAQAPVNDGTNTPANDDPLKNV